MQKLFPQADNHQDSDEELQEKQEKNSKLVIDDEEELKEVPLEQHEQNNTNIKQEAQKHQQVQKQQVIQQQPNEQPKKLLHFDYQDINIKVKPEWKDKRQNPEPNKFDKKAVIEIKEPVLYTMDKQKPKHGRSFLLPYFLQIIDISTLMADICIFYNQRMIKCL